MSKFDKLLDQFIKDSRLATAHIESTTSHERGVLCRQVRRDILLPFCKKHKLCMHIGIYDNMFTAVDGTEYNDYELKDHFKDGELIEKSLKIDFMGDHLFDYNMECDIEEKDWS